MELKRYQTGGVFYTPFFRDAEVQQVASTAKDGDKEENLIQKETIDLISEKGLPNDRRYFAMAANKFLVGSQNLSSIFGDGGSGQYSLSKLIKLQTMANEMRYNNELYKNALSQITKEGSGSEAAVSNDGNLYAIDKDRNVKTLTYYVLTNNQLMQLRANQDDLANHDEILSDLNNTVGIKSIVDYVKQTISSFGTNKSSNKFDKFTVKEKDQIERGFEELLSVAPDGIYKVSGKTTVSDQGFSNDENMQFAVNYLYRTLPTNMKNVLRANVASEGGNPNDIKDVQSLLVMAITEHTDHSRDFEQSVDYQSDMTKASNVGAGAQEKEDKLNREQMIFAGKQVKPELITIGASSDHGGIQVLSQRMGNPQDKNGAQLGLGTVADVITKDPVGNGIMKNSISFGDKILSENDLRRIVYDGISNYERMYLPIDQQLYVNTGKIAPDLNAYKKFEKFLEWKNAGNGVSNNSIIMKLNELNLDLVQNKDGEWVFRDAKPFLVLNGYASSKALDFNTNSSWVQHMERSEGKRIFDLYGRIINYGQAAKSKSTYRDDFSGGWFGIGDAGSMYKSAIFMPMLDPGTINVATGYEYVNRDTLRDTLNKREQLEASRIKTNF